MRRADDLRQPNRIVRLTVATSVLVLAAALAAVPAHAKPTWHHGAPEYSAVTNCNSDPEEGIRASAGFYVDPQSLPRVGDVFYVATDPARIGGGCGAHMGVHVEVVPPLGVTPAISASTPVYCTYINFATGAETPAEGCPQTPTQGMHGLAFDQTTPNGPQAWDMPDGYVLLIQIPMRSTRKLVGDASQRPSCGRVDGSPPCPADQAGDHVQFANKVIDGWGSPWLAPHVGLFVREADTPPPPPGPNPNPPAPPGPTPNPPPAPTPDPTLDPIATAQSLLASPPRTIRVKRLRRGVPVAVRVEQSNSRIRARLTVRGRTVARGSTRGARGGTRTVRLRATRTGALQLRRLRKPTGAILHVRITPPSGRATTTTANIKLLP
ncbi:MAG: hypothetical protein M3N04_06035 [Actinomycetota bacterium]|nr:hypothetical protein [Actinomycetota bacterium]